MVLLGLERFFCLLCLVAYNVSYFKPFYSTSTKIQDATVAILTESILRVIIHRIGAQPKVYTYLSRP